MPRPIYCLMFKNLCGMKEKFIKEGPRTRPYDQLWKSSLTGILIILFLLWQRPPGTLEVSVDEGSLPITPDVFVYTVGEAGNNTTDTEEFNNSKMTKQTPQSWFLAGQKDSVCTLVAMHQCLLLGFLKRMCEFNYVALWGWRQEKSSASLFIYIKMM